MAVVSVRASVLLCSQLVLIMGAKLDMSHPYNNETLDWPGVRAFEFTVMSKGMTDKGFWYEANRIATPEHCGTHIDAPRHFAKDTATVEQIDVDRLIRPVVAIDMSSKAAQDPDALLTVEDIQDWEKQYGEIPDGDIVLINCGWEQYYPDVKKYFGNDVQNASDFHFPGLDPEAAIWLAEKRKIVGVGLDTPSIDHGPSQLFQAHVNLGLRNVYILENVKNIGKMPITGATLYVMPMKIAGGSGAPTRITAVWDTETSGGAIKIMSVVLTTFVISYSFGASLL